MKVIVTVLLVSVVFLPPTTAQEVSLNSTLIQKKFARPNQAVIFTCVTRGANILTWNSTEYIGMGNEFQILSAGDAVDRTRGTTVATRMDTYDDNGVMVIVSQLRVTALLQFPTSSVTCRVNGVGGPSETINFITTMQEVSLNSTLIQGRYAAPNKVVNFTCVTKGANILTWSSTEYIGMGNEFQILSAGDAVDRTRGTTVATRMDTYDDDSGDTMIVSQLRIIALLQFPTSSVICCSNGGGPSETINFITTEITTTSAAVISETESATTRASSNNVPVDDPQQQKDSSSVIYVVAGGGGGGLLVLAIVVIITIIVFIIIRKRKNEPKKNSVEPEKDIESCPPKGDSSSCSRSSTDESETSSSPFLAREVVQDMKGIPSMPCVTTEGQRAMVG